MDIAQKSINSEDIISQNSSSILHIQIFDGNRMLTLGADGQVHIYRKDQNKWIHKSCIKLFQCPLVAYDIQKYLSNWQFIAIAFSGQIKKCRLNSQDDIVVQSTMDFKVGSPIVSCVWGNNQKQIIVTTQSGILGIINLAQINNIQLFRLANSQSKSNAILARKGYNTLYVSLNNKIEHFQYSLKDKSQAIQRKQILQLDADIIDFTVSKQAFYANLVVITKKYIRFYLFQNHKPLLISFFQVNRNAISFKLGWGVSYNEIGLYECLKGVIKVKIFRKQLTGKWYMDLNEKQYTKQSMIQQQMQDQ